MTKSNYYFDIQEYAKYKTKHINTLTRKLPREFYDEIKCLINTLMSVFGYLFCFILLILYYTLGYFPFIVFRYIVGYRLRKRFNSFAEHKKEDVFKRHTFFGKSYIIKKENESE
jgi:hypothetical protein